MLVAPVLPYLTDTDEALDALLGRIAAAGAGSASVMALHLRPGAREWFLAMVERDHPSLLPAYRRLYARGSYAPAAYRDELARRVAPLLARHGLTRPSTRDGGGLFRPVGTGTEATPAPVPTLF